MELESTANKQDWIDFGDPPNEKAVQFMMEHFGFPNTDHLSDEECEELASELHEIEAYEHYLADRDVDRNDPKNYDEYGSLMRRPLSEYALMIAGMIVYIGNQFHAGKRKWQSQEIKLYNLSTHLCLCSIKVGMR